MLKAVTPGGLQWYFSDPAQMGMGFTGIAHASGIATASFNPGAIVFSRTSGVQAGFSIMRPATSFLEPPQRISGYQPPPYPHTRISQLGSPPQ